MGEGLIFRQLFEPVSSTYTYLIGCKQSGSALLIDPVLPTWERDLALVRDLGLNLRYTLETHIHADHITSARRLKRETGSRIAGPIMDALPCTDLGLEDGALLRLGEVQLQAMHTPGHTDNHMAYVAEDRVFTGDALLIDGCGRTDFQNGDAGALYNSVRRKLFALSDETLVYPAHDYRGRFVSTIAQEKTRNPRLGGDKSLEDFTRIMGELDLPYPKFIDFAVPGNRACGQCPPGIPEHMQEYCDSIRTAVQG